MAAGNFSIQDEYANSGTADAAATTDDTSAAPPDGTLSFDADQVAEMKTLKDNQDMAGLGEYVAKYL